MILPGFDFARLPRLLFGAGRVREIPAQVAAFGERLLIVTGARSFPASLAWAPMMAGLEARGISWRLTQVSDEPSPELVDQALETFRPWSPRVVLGVGGGSVLDAAKAIAGLLPHKTSVMDHLEGVGRGIPYQGPSTPFVAVPTTAGTGSEATKNAVLSLRGADGFKKSFRHEALVAQVAIVDPELLAGCPPELMAAQGMDAFTQLLESFVSIRANPMTEALAWSGMTQFRAGLDAAMEGEADGRARIAYGSLQSGICLAQTGLGAVHGLASPLGAFFPIPHGLVCGTLLAEATAINIRALGQRAPYGPAVEKYARVGRLLCGQAGLSQEAALTALVDELDRWTKRLGLSRLSALGLTSSDIPRVVAQSRGGSMQTNPIELTDAELAEVLERRL